MVIEIEYQWLWKTLLRAKNIINNAISQIMMFLLLYIFHLKFLLQFYKRIWKSQYRSPFTVISTLSLFPLIECFPIYSDFSITPDKWLLWCYDCCHGGCLLNKWALLQTVLLYFMIELLNFPNKVTKLAKINHSHFQILLQKTKLVVAYLI